MSEKSIAKRASQKNALTELFRINGVAVMCAHSGEDDMISLTGIHKASGEGEGKKPSRWMSLESTQSFLSVFEEMDRRHESVPSTESPADRAKESGLIKVLRGGVGGGGETFAHNEIALEYAAYLSPMLRIQINRAFKERLQAEAEERFRREKLRAYLPDKPHAQKPLRKRQLLKKLAVSIGHPEWYDESNGQMHICMSRVIHALEGKKLHPALLEMAKEKQVYTPGGYRRYRLNQLLDGEAKEAHEEIAENWQQLLETGWCEDFQTLKVFHDLKYPDPDQDQLEMFRPSVRMIPAFAQV